MGDDIDAWIDHFTQELENLKYRMSFKVRRSTLEQISWRQQRQRAALSDSPPEQNRNLPTSSDSERMCLEFVESGELNLAFSAMLEYFDAIAGTKAERNDVTGTATQAYAESLVDRLSLISGQQIDEVMDHLNRELTAKVDSLVAAFTDMRDSIEIKMIDLENEIVGLEESLLLCKFDASDRLRDQKSDKALNDKPRPQPQTDLTPRRQALHRSFEMRRATFGRSKAGTGQSGPDLKPVIYCMRPQPPKS
jgi:cysteinyl-tRNA synthetase